MVPWLDEDPILSILVYLLGVGFLAPNQVLDVLLSVLMLFANIPIGHKTRISAEGKGVLWEE